MKKEVKEIEFEIKETNKEEDGCTYTLSLTIPSSYGWLEDVYFIIRENDENIMYPLTYEEEKSGKITFTSNIFLPTRALYNYFLSFKANNEIYNITKDHVRTDFDLSDAFKLSVNFDVPDWAKGKIMYHIFVDRFKKGRTAPLIEIPKRHIHTSWNEPVQLGPDQDGIWNNDFYGGDLQGIIDNLDYIKTLGVEILYLSPIVLSQSTHRYDSADFEQIDPYAGNKEDLKKLCDEAHKKGMKVILDAVFNHTGNDSKYFNEYNTFDTVGAYQSIDSPYLPFYDYEIIDGKPKFKYWWGQLNLPKCNSDGKPWREYITGKDGIIDQWFALGVDGLRLDVPDELADSMIEDIRVAVRRNKKDGLIIGEVWESPLRKGRNYISSGKGMDTVMNYNFTSSLIKYFRYGDVDELKGKLKEILYEYPDPTLFSAMLSTSTHDMTRAINLWDNDIFQENGEWPWNLKNEDLNFIRNYQLNDKYSEARDMYMAYVFALAGLPGTLSIFYGDEVGAQGIGNLNNRCPYPWGQEDRTIQTFFQQTIAPIRTTEKFLEQADTIPKEITPTHFAYERVKDDNQMLFLINRTKDYEPITIPEEYQSSKKVYTLKKSTTSLLTPYGGIAVKR